MLIFLLLLLFFFLLLLFLVSLLLLFAFLFLFLILLLLLFFLFLILYSLSYCSCSSCYAKAETSYCFSTLTSFVFSQLNIKLECQITAWMHDSICFPVLDTYFLLFAAGLITPNRRFVVKCHPPRCFSSAVSFDGVGYQLIWFVIQRAPMECLRSLRGRDKARLEHALWSIRSSLTSSFPD